MRHHPKVMTIDSSLNSEPSIVCYIYNSVCTVVYVRARARARTRTRTRTHKHKQTNNIIILYYRH